MISPTTQPITIGPRTYPVPEDLLDNMLVGQKDKILRWVSEMESCKDATKFNNLKQRVLGALIIVMDLWSIFEYSYKAEEITERLQTMKTEHPLGHLL